MSVVVLHKHMQKPGLQLQRLSSIDAYVVPLGSAVSTPLGLDCWLIELIQCLVSSCWLSTQQAALMGYITLPDWVHYVVICIYDTLVFPDSFTQVKGTVWIICSRVV